MVHIEIDIHKSDIAHHCTSPITHCYQTLQVKQMPPVYSNRWTCRWYTRQKVLPLHLWTPSACPHLLHLCAHTRLHHFEAPHLHQPTPPTGHLHQRRFVEIFPGATLLILHHPQDRILWWKEPPQSTSLVFIAVDLSHTHRMWEPSGLEIFSQRKSWQLKKKCSEKLVSNFGWSWWRLPWMSFVLEK